MNLYQLFKDLIDILTPAEMLKILSERLKGRIPDRDIAYTIYETKGICPFCLDRGVVEKKKCPVCSAGAEDCVRFQMNRRERYRLILQHTSAVWEKFMK